MSMKIGIVVATKEEMSPFFEVFGQNDQSFSAVNGSYEAFKWDLKKHNSAIYLVQSGFGEIAATSSVQYLISEYGVNMVINYGVVGGLDDGCSVGKIGYVERAVHYDFDISANGHYAQGEYPGKGVFLRPEKDAIPQPTLKYYGLSEFVCASADKFVAAGEPKRKLKRDFGADICEMEAAGIIITCNRNSVPVTLIKAVSDGVNEDSEAFKKNVQDASFKCVKIIHKILCNA